jgi:response regulator RpfG family c-di-GMP phosphodiesterase
MWGVQEVPAAALRRRKEMHAGPACLYSAAMFRNCLVVSAHPPVRERLAAALRERGLTVTLAASGDEALAVVKNVAVDTVLVDGAPVGMKLETLRRKVESMRSGCRVVAATSAGPIKGTAELLRLGEDDFLLRARDLARLIPDVDVPKQEAPPATRERVVTTALLSVIDVLVGLLELRDRYFGGSSHQAMRLARAVAERLAADPETPDEVALAALLRDLGRADVPADILQQQGELTDAQRDLVRAHVDAGVRLVESIDFPWKIVPLIRHHHERYDGTGYPDGLRGREIPIGSRILAVVDAFLAMVSERPHRKAMTAAQALDELIRHAGTQFDPEVVEVFLGVAEGMYPKRAEHGRYRVLLVDGDEEYRNLLRMRLLNDDHETICAGTVDEALEALLAGPFDLVAAALGHDDGPFRLLEEMRRDETLRSVPFVCLAPGSERTQKIRALRVGVDDFIPREVDLEEAVARLENVLVRESARRDGAASGAKRGISGRLENLGLPDIVQILHIGMKTAAVTLHAEKLTGKLWFEGGAARHAKVGDLEGEAAFFTMLRWQEGDFTIEHGVRTRKATLDADPMFLVMEGLRLLDEAAETA